MRCSGSVGWGQPSRASDRTRGGFERPVLKKPLTYRELGWLGGLPSGHLVTLALARRRGHPPILDRCGQGSAPVGALISLFLES